MHHINRRRFVQGVVGGAWLASFGRVLGAEAPRTELTGPEFDLTIDEQLVDITGRPRRAVLVNGQLPAPLLRFRQSETVTIRVRNRLRVPTSIHWHGLIVPADMDGVPGLSFDGIAPGTTFTYRYKVNQSGTYWYHSHSRFQEQTGLYGPLVIERAAGERHHHDREHTLLLSDWTDHDPESIYATLKKQSSYYNFHKPTLADLAKMPAAERRMWASMRMNPTDLADVSGYEYTYLLNGAPPARNWTALFEPGERVRLRLINGSSMSFFDVRIPGLPLTVVAADGQDIEPVTVDELRIGTAEVYDVIVQPTDAAYTIFAQSMDRTGFARGTLAPRAGLEAPVPPLDARVMLGMGDMGMAMDHGGTAGMDHGSMNHAGMPQDATPPVKHPPDEHGPNVDMLADAPRLQLDDPGIGLRDNGRTVLAYSRLATLGGSIDTRSAARELELHLTGHMERFVWSFSGLKFSDARPLPFAHNERLRIVLVNDSMMTHPIHLHGMWSELVDARGEFLARKHTVIVQPGQKIAYEVTADALGRWAYHCHLLYHMEAGMFREVVVA